MHVRAYTIGDELTFRTIYDQWFTGVIDDLRRDTIYISGQAFSYKEIDAIKRERKGGGLGAKLLEAGGGFIVISAVNGLLRKDAAKDWFTTSGYIIGGGLLASGLLLIEMKGKYYPLGRKYKLLYLQIGKR